MMGRFETPTTNPNLAAKLQGLDLQAVTIARSEEQSAKLDDFVATYVTPDTLSYGANGREYLYEYRRISALGRAGTLLHARMHAYPLADVDPGVRNIVIVDSIGSTHPEELWPARSIEQPSNVSQSTDTVLERGYVDEVEQSLRPVPDGMTEADWQEQEELSRILEQEALLGSVPQIRFGNRSWTYRHANGMIEPLRDLLPLQRSIHLAVSRGLGHAATGQEQYLAENMPYVRSMGN